jgi:hypothetical protein
MKKYILVGTVLLFALAGCAGNPPSNENSKSDILDSQLKSIKVVVQVCFPAANDPGHVVIRSITPFSEGGGRIDKTGSTPANQSIFETFTESPSDLRAVIVNFGDSNYSYLAKPIPSTLGTWSDWKLPDFVTERAFDAFLKSHVPPSEAVPPNAAKIRFGVMPFGEYLDRANSQSKRGKVPSC